LVVTRTTIPGFETLSYITSLSLEKITFEIHHYRSNEIAALDLGWLDELLAPSLFDGLKLVVFELLYGGFEQSDSAVEEEMIKRKLKGLVARNILIFN